MKKCEREREKDRCRFCLQAHVQATQADRWTVKLTKPSFLQLLPVGFLKATNWGWDSRYDLLPKGTNLSRSLPLCYLFLWNLEKLYLSGILTHVSNRARIRQLCQKLFLFWPKHDFLWKQMKTPRPFLGGGSMLYLHGVTAGLCIPRACGGAVRTLGKAWLCGARNAQQPGCRSQSPLQWRAPAAEHHIGAWLLLGSGWSGRQEISTQLRTGESLLTWSAGPAPHLTLVFSGPSFERSRHRIEIKPEQSWGCMRNTKAKINNYSISSRSCHFQHPRARVCSPARRVKGWPCPHQRIAGKGSPFSWAFVCPLSCLQVQVSVVFARGKPESMYFWLTLIK